MKKISAILGIAISTIYLLNFTLGVAELPDNLPFIGHIDEFVAATLLIASLRYFGYDITNWFTKDKAPKQKDHKQ